jgi:hypothetical protein
MGHRQHVIREQQKLHQPLAFANKQPKPPAAQAQVTIENLIPFLASQGAKAGWKVWHDPEKKIVCLEASVGPIRIPLGLTIEEVKQVILGLADAANELEQAAEAAEETAPSEEDLTYSLSTMDELPIPAEAAVAV